MSLYPAFGEPNCLIKKREDLSELTGKWSSGTMMGSSQPLMLENEREEIRNPCKKSAKKGEGSEVKSAAALKSHSEAEKRRRERINAHLSTLKGLVPTNHKMDKATLLAEVISHVKQLKKNATQVSDAFLIPLDSDELRVEHIDDVNMKEGIFSFRASICCEYRPGLLSELREAIETLNLNLVRSEISTLGDRVKNVFFFTSSKRDILIDVEYQELLVSCIHQALKPILDKAAESVEFPTGSMIFPGKRQRVSYFEYSSSSS